MKRLSGEKDAPDADKGLTRRDFIKKAGVVLPSIAVLGLGSFAEGAGLPGGLDTLTGSGQSGTSNGYSEYRTGCNWGCAGSCANRCGGTCSFGCDNTCRGTCYQTCSGSCQNSCRGTCSGSCARMTH